MKIAVVLFAVFGASMAQVYHVAQPAYHVAQPVAAYVSQPRYVSSELKKPIAILRQSGNLADDGSFSYDFESENGISAQAASQVRSLGPDQLAQTVQGSYSYTAPDGSPITVQYVADENGFHAEGAHLPTPPPIPEAIAKALQTLPTLEEFERQEAARSASYARRA